MGRNCNSSTSFQGMLNRVYMSRSMNSARIDQNRTSGGVNSHSPSSQNHW